jgi:hypothetical protein
MVRKTGFRFQVSGVRLILSGLVLLLAPGTWHPVPAFPQQPQAQQGQPLYAFNAKYVNGVAPGYWPTPGSGLTLNLSPGTANCGGVILYAGGTLTMMPSSTNYVFLNTSSSCIPGVNTTGFGANIPIATVVTGASSITSVSDLRTMFGSSNTTGLNGAAIPTSKAVLASNSSGQLTPSANVVSVTDYGASCTASDNSSAFATALSMIPAGGGTLFIPPCVLPYNIASGRVAVTTSNVLVSGYGATLLCTVSDDCVTLGNLSNPNANINIFVKGITLEPGAGSTGHSAIRDNAQDSHIEDVGFAANGSNRFKHGIENDDDQGQVLKKIFAPAASVFVCSSGFCGSVVWGPGPYSVNAGIVYLSDFAFNLGCSGNGIDYQDGNALHVGPGVIQGYNQFAIRSNAGVTKINVHEEVGNCTNPLGNVGEAGDIVTGGTEASFGGEFGAFLPVFPQAGTTGSTNYGYYVVGTNSGGNSTGPLPIGYLTNGNATVNSTNNIVTTWNDFEQGNPTFTYALLRYPATSPRSAPYGTGNWAVATGLAEGTVCSGGVCTYTDTVTTPSSYTVAAYLNNYWNWQPSLSMWPGSVILSGGSNFYGDTLWEGGDIVNTLGYQPGGVAGFGSTYSYGADPEPFSPGLMTALNAGTVNFPFQALVMNQSYSGGGSGLKGILNLGAIVSGSNGDSFTLGDSNPAKTFSTVTQRPAYDTADAAFCFDGSISNACMRAQSSISQYINHLPDGLSWLERLTSSLKTFKVPLGSFSVAQVASPTLYSVSDVATGGTLSPNTQYCYRVTALDQLGETAPSTQVCATTANDGNSTHQMALAWYVVAIATGGYKAYGRTSGSEQLLISSNTFAQNTAAVFWNDTGSLTPSGAMPANNTTGQIQASIYSLTGGGTVTQTIASGATAMGTTLIASAACASAVSVAATGVLTTDVIEVSFNGDPTGVTGYVPATMGMLTIIPYPTAGYVNFKVCNNTGSSITPGGITLNWRVTR